MRSSLAPALALATSKRESHCAAGCCAHQGWQQGGSCTDMEATCRTAALSVSPWLCSTCTCCWATGSAKCVLLDQIQALIWQFCL